MGLWEYISKRITDYAFRLTPKVCLENIAYFVSKVDQVLSQMPEYRSAILSLADLNKWRNLAISSLVAGWLLKLSKSHGEMNDNNPVYNMMKDAFYKIGLSELWPLVLDCMATSNYLVDKEKDINNQIAVATWLCFNAQDCCLNLGFREQWNRKLG